MTYLCCNVQVYTLNYSFKGKDKIKMLISCGQVRAFIFGLTKI